MDKFQNKLTGEIVEANSFVELFAFTHNSNYIPVEITGVEDKDISKFSKKELIKYLTDLEINFDKNMSKEELLELALNEDNNDNEVIVEDDVDNEEIIVEDIIEEDFGSEE